MDKEEEEDFCHERRTLGPGRKAKVEGSLIRLFKAKEGSRSIRVLVYLNILRLANPASLA
jgi:hypothetical protein